MRMWQRNDLISRTGCVVALAAAVLIGSVRLVSAEAYHHYDISAAWDPVTKTISAVERVVVVNRQGGPIDHVYFHIYPNRRYTSAEQRLLFQYAGYFKIDPYPEGFDTGDFYIDAVVDEASGDEVPWTVEGADQTLLRVDLPGPVAPGAQIEVTVKFRLRVPHAYGRIGWHGSVVRAAYWYPIVAAQAASGWDKGLFYPFHRPFYSDAASYDVTLTVPEDYQVAHSGVRSREETSGGQKRVIITTSLPIRAFAFSASPEYQHLSVRRGKTDLYVFYLEGDEDRAADALASAEAAMDFYEAIFQAPYPYEQFSVAAVHLGYGGEQMANMIFIDTRAFKLPGILDRHFDFLIAHETGHQWLYNMIGVDASREMWLEEGINSFLTLQYIEERYGKDASVLEFPRWLSGIEPLLPRPSFRRFRDYRYKAGLRAGYDGPLARRLDEYSEPSQIFALIYGKGERVIEALEAEIGSAAMRAVLAEAMARYRYQNWSIPDFQALCEKVSGRDLDAFFRNWVYGSGRYDPCLRRVAPGVLEIAQHGDLVAPVEVETVGASGSTERFIWDGSSPATIDLAARGLRGARLDPDEKTLDQDRVNNVWPRWNRARPVWLYLGLWDHPAFVPDDAYQLVIGPEINEGVGLKAGWQKPYQYYLYAGNDYDIGNELFTSRVGFQYKNFWTSPTHVGGEWRRVKDVTGGPDDMISTKMYVRQDLWPAAYGMLDVQDHLTLYVVDNQRPDEYDEGLMGASDLRNIEYRRDHESIVGMAFHRNRSGPYPDPREGHRLTAVAEQAGHVFGAGSYFSRGGVDIHGYHRMMRQGTVALRAKIGAGYPDDKDLFQLGGAEGLRGYERKSLRGANAALGVIECRYPLINEMSVYAVDRLVGLRRIDGVIFAEAGQAWFDSMSETALKKDIGIGLRFHVDLLGFLEKAVIQLDAARPVRDAEDDLRFWLRVNSVF